MMFKVLTAILLMSVGTLAQLPIAPQITTLRSQVTACNGRFVCSVVQTTAACTVTCITPNEVCDFTSQCPHGEDEHDCPRMCEGMVICADRRTCAIPCDGINHCTALEDEQNCPPKCTKLQLLCNNRATCATPCNGVNECPTNEDETGCAMTCPAGRVLCSKGGMCAIPCNGASECPDGSDEHDCPFQCRCTPGQYVCLASRKCLVRTDVCEGSTLANDAASESCFTGTGTGDDEANTGFGFLCTA